MNVTIGLSLLILGGISAGSSYVPMKKVKGWAWESLWAVQGLMAWLLLPFLLAFVTVPHLLQVISAVPTATLFNTYLLGFLWGIGGLAWGIAVRYIGLALGFSIATGFLSSLGTLVPVVVNGKIHEIISTTSGKITLLSVGLSIIGIAICGRAGLLRDRERAAGAGNKTNGSRGDEGPGAGAPAFQFRKGVLIALAAGVLAACFAFGIHAGDPLRQQAIAAGASPVWASTPIFFIELLGGITFNLLYSLYLNQKNKTFSDYGSAADGRLAPNYLFSSLMGTLWYLQFVFYGVAAFFMGQYSFANWSIHMSFMVVASNLWGYYFKEWEGTSAATVRWNNAGILVLVIAGVVMGMASH